jgi:hypothetical protein
VPCPGVFCPSAPYSGVSSALEYGTQEEQFWLQGVCKKLESLSQNITNKEPSDLLPMLLGTELRDTQHQGSFLSSVSPSVGPQLPLSFFHLQAGIGHRTPAL